MSVTEIYSPGLEGITAGETAISMITEGLRYRGYSVTELADKVTFEDTAYLLLHGEIPSAAELTAFRSRLAGARQLPAPLRELLKAERVTRLTALSLQTSEHYFGVILLADAVISRVGGLGQGALVGLALQISLSLEHYLAVQNANRRTKEFELLTEVGQAIAAHLDEPSLLLTIYRETGYLMDIQNLYIAVEKDGKMCWMMKKEITII